MSNTQGNNQPQSQQTKRQIIEAYGLTTKVWHFNDKTRKYGCAECCNGDHGDDDCDHKYYRKNCPHCKGTGWIPESEVKPAPPSTSKPESGVSERPEPVDLNTYMAHLEYYIRENQRCQLIPDEYFKGKVDAYRYAMKKIKDMIAWTGDPYAKQAERSEQAIESIRYRDDIIKNLEAKQAELVEENERLKQELQDEKDYLRGIIKQTEQDAAREIDKYRP